MNMVDVTVIHNSRHTMLCLIETLHSKPRVFCSFVYAANSRSERKELWKDIIRAKRMTTEWPWMMIGDFNVTLKNEDHSNGGYRISNDMQDFINCVNTVEMEDLCSNGVYYTWIKSPLNPQNSILIKLERAMVNEELMLKFPDANALFLPYLVSDHSPMVVKEDLKVAQVNLDKNPHNHDIKEKEVIALKEYNEALKDEESLLSQKIKNAMFDIDNKAPSPDGYTSAFYKKAWKIVGKDVFPKVSTPNKVSDYRLIACCNVVYKCISKILTDRIKYGLHKLVNLNQSAFIQGRIIQNNILVTQEPLKGYDGKNGPCKCCLKIDIAKAYDTVDWKFLEKPLVHFGFHEKMVKWIGLCYYCKVLYLSKWRKEGVLFKLQGLRQGDLTNG
nr:RNA-directed DNA polymerase, eukaryota, reverse transcriptase zinc-binding domain protein [Tanacetum cinerariifolium]